MDTDKIEGAAKGAVDVGGAIDDASSAAAARAGELSDKAEKLYTDATTLVRDRTAESPLAALGIALLAGFFVGVIWSGGGDFSRRPDAFARSQRGNRINEC